MAKIPLVKHAKISRSLFGAVSVRFQCINCKSPLTAKRSEIGRLDRCPDCGQTFVLSTEIERAISNAESEKSLAKAKASEAKILAKQQAREAKQKLQRDRELEETNRREISDRTRKSTAQQSIQDDDTSIALPDSNSLPKARQNDSKLENCANCSRVIGRLESPRKYESQTVCIECHERLSLRTTRAIEDTNHKTNRCCPACGSTIQPIRKSKGSVTVAILLLCLWIVPGVLYLIVYSGYVYACPDCGFKYGDAT